MDGHVSNALADGAPRGDGADTEFELKLTGSNEAVAAAFAAAGKDAARTAERRLVSVYFDTPDRRLAAKGFTLRIRDRGDGFTQTLKADRTAPARLELETVVPDARPDLGALGLGPLRDALGAVFPEELEACFTTDVLRRTKLVAEVDALGRSSEVEIAHDRGRWLLPDGREAPLNEIEIERKAGDRQAVFELAKVLAAGGATLLVVRSKAARGHALADPRPPAGTKADRVRLDRGMALGHALGAVFENCFGQWYANHDAAFEGRSPEGLHQLRVGLRRLRSVLTCFGSHLAPTRLAWLKDEARAVMTALGPARDLDVFTAELLPPVLDAWPNDAALGELCSTIALTRSEAYDEVRAMLASRRYTEFLLDLGAWIDRRGWWAEADRLGQERFEAPLGPFADALLAKRAKVARKRGKGFAKLDPAARHEVRIALKKLRYAIDFTRDLYPAKRVKPYLAHLARLQDAFGHMNDQAQAQALLDRLAAGDGSGRLAVARGLVLGWYAHAAAGNEVELVADWQAFKSTEPFWPEASPC
ncbi:MAG: CHAD domain-containing protein [Geminicoccaceae bacterium]|nr:MAG: CHAD domain-containing protein [Geminicoccaceae bacterium]